VASEMLYPVMPVYLKSIGFSVLLIGILEGIAEATAGLSKGYFGKLSDNSGKRIPFVQAGYALSAISKPMMTVFITPLWIFLARTLDRLGKGIRTGARDAILSDEATPETKGKIFGFHRSMDTLGAVLGPALAILYLYFFPGHYRQLFIIAFFPGIIAIIVSRLLHKKDKAPVIIKKTASFFSSISYWRTSPPMYRKLVVGLLVFALFNSSDVFLLLKGKQAGLGDETVIWVYIAYNLVYALSSFPLGIIADKIGLKTIFLLGLILFALVYFGMSSNIHLSVYLILYSLYGIYAAATDGISKAWISNIADKKDIATAIGTYSGFQSICTLLASWLTGFVWYSFGQSSAFLLTGSITVLVVFYFLINVPGVKKVQ